MAHTEPYSITRSLRSLVALREGNVLTDAQLLERFIHERDEASFELLVRRHGPMVLAACQRLLRDRHEAEDAFQATFLTLFRQAGAIRRREAIAGWLYQVACRISFRARAGLVRRRLCPAPEISCEADPARQEMVSEEARSILDEELLGLPEKYRLPLVLCYLEGKTAAEVARLFSCPRGTVLSRLQRGRQRLRLRLERRGLALAAAALGMLPSLHEAAAAVPYALVDATLNTTLQLAAGQPVTSLVSQKIIRWTEAGERAMSLCRIQLPLVFLGALFLGAVFLWEPILAGKISGAGNGPSIQNKALDSPTPPPQGPKGFPLDKEITAVRWSNDGKLLASYGTRKTVDRGKLHHYCTFKLWDAETGKEKISLGEIENPGVQTFVFAPDGKVLAVSHRNSIQGGDHVDLYDVAKGALIRTIDAAYGRSRMWFAFSPDGKAIAVAYGGPSHKLGGGARLFDTATGKLKLTLLEHENIANTVAFGPDGKTLATGSSLGEVLLWDRRKGKSLRKLLGMTAPLLALTFSPDGQTVAGSSADALLLWDVRTGKTRELKGSNTVANEIHFNRDGTLLATAGTVVRDGKQTGEVNLWNLHTGDLVKTWEATSPSSIAFAPDGNSLNIFHADRKVRSWDVRPLLRRKAGE